MVAASPRTAAHGTQIEQPRATFTHRALERGQHHGTILLVRPDGQRGEAGSRCHTTIWPAPPRTAARGARIERPMPLLPTPNRGRRGGPDLSVRRDGRGRVGACGRGCYGLPRGSGRAARPELACGGGLLAPTELPFGPTDQKDFIIILCPRAWAETMRVRDGYYG